MPIFLLYYSKKRRIFFLYFFLISSFLGLLGFILLENGIFDYKVIDHKYCYYYEPGKNEQCSIYDNADITNKKDNAFQVFNYYCNLLDTNMREKSLLLEFTSDFFIVPKFYRVDVLEYSEDSMLAKVRTSCEARDNKSVLFTHIGYVPRFTLFDTLPPLVKDTLKINNWKVPN